MRDRAEVASLASSERDIVDYVRQLMRTSGVSQPLFDRLRDAHGVRWLVTPSRCPWADHGARAGGGRHGGSTLGGEVSHE